MSFFTAIALASFVAAPVSPDPIKQAQESFQGEWKMVDFISGGEAEGKDLKADSKITVKDDTMLIRFRGNDTKANFTLNPKTDPPTIDFKYQTRNGESLHKGIYKLEEDKLTICFGLNGADRPTEFKSPEKTRIAMFILERVKK